MAYPDKFFDHLDRPSIGFPSNKRPLADKLSIGGKVFIYLTSPVRRIVGLGEISSSMKEIPGDRWPYQFDVEWVVGPCYPGVTFKEAGIPIRPRPGDTNFKISSQDAQRIIDILKDQQMLKLSMVHKLIGQKK